MIVLLLLLMSGDIETNPGPVGECYVVNCTQYAVYMEVEVCTASPSPPSEQDYMCIYFKATVTTN